MYVILMTTIKELKFKCPNCSEVFQGTIIGSMGYKGVDEQFCHEYWGLNPMPYFLLACPHCNHVDWPSSFEQLGEDLDESLLHAEPSCELFEKYVQLLIQQNAEPILIAYISQQSGCCRRVNGEDPTSQFQRAAEYFRKAKEAGVKEFSNRNIDEWIQRMDDSICS